MSATAELQVLAAPAGESAFGSLPARRQIAGPAVRLVSFAALACYGVLRWSTLLTPAPGARLFGLLGVALLLAGCGAVLGSRARPLTAVIAVLAVVVLFPLSGVPVGWTFHLRVGAIANGISEGISTLPRILVPYGGINEWVRTVIVLGAGLLLTCAGLVLAFGARAVGDLRRACAALPLVALSVVPATIVHPQHPYLQGLALFALLAAFVWGERLAQSSFRGVLFVCALAAAAGMILAPALDTGKPWINYEALAQGLAPKQVETFDWSQRYGPLNWPRQGHDLLEVQAARPDYWKAENLDLFDGRAFVAWPVNADTQAAAPDASAVARWSQTLQVTIRGMSTSDLVAAGSAQQPQDAPTAVIPGASGGTWSGASELGPGDSYVVRVYSPDPSAAELASAGSAIPADALRNYLSLSMPEPGSAPPQQVKFAPFGSGGSPQNDSDVPAYSGPAAVANSPYSRAFALAQTLASRSSTPYGFVINVEGFLAHGYLYNESPPNSAFPLANFLFTDKAGYCQQFAGAMALLLRMGGVPARVAVGFTTGTYDASTHRWVVSDLDAHSWVEAWFPHYGWVRFDPTPAAAPARGGRSTVPASPGAAPSAPAPRPAISHHRSPPPSATPPRPVRHTVHSSSSVPTLAPLAAGAGLVLVVWLLFARARRQPSGDQLLLELERAMARSGRPLGPDVTLAALERRFESSPSAVAYIRAIRMQRYGGGGESPTLQQRRALRAQLRAGLGLVGAARALWALPPRWRPENLPRHGHEGA